MVDAVTTISGISASSPTKVGTSTSISSEPDNAWVAARQSHITADLLELKRAADAENRATGNLHPHGDTEIVSPDDQSSHHRRGHGNPDALDSEDAQAAQPTLSGESDRIGTRNFDESTPFGARVTIL